MGLTNHKEEQLKKQPLLETKVFKSQNGQYIVFKTTITEIKPISYMEKVVSNPPMQQEQEEAVEA